MKYAFKFVVLTEYAWLCLSPLFNQTQLFVLFPILTVNKTEETINLK